MGVEGGGVKDKWSEQRPLLGIVDSISAVSGRLHSTLSILSLATGAHVHALKFDEPIAAVQASQRSLNPNLAHHPTPKPRLILQLRSRLISRSLCCPRCDELC